MQCTNLYTPEFFGSFFIDAEILNNRSIFLPAKFDQILNQCHGHYI